MQPVGVSAIGVVLVLAVLWDAFETIILPRRVTRRFRLTRAFYRATWLPWSGVVGKIRSKHRAEALLSFYGPGSLLALLSLWAVVLIVGFAFLHAAAGQIGGPAMDMYMSGATFFTLGFSDTTPTSWPARFVTILEAGVGFAFLAIIIGYLPVIYQSFSRREVIISMLDARAGSPPTSTELLRRHRQDHGLDALDRMLRDWEEWSAELLETHLSYPVLAYFRSQHDNQSWLAALTTILDASALVMSGFEGVSSSQARLTFAIARHALVDLSQIFNVHPKSRDEERPLNTEEFGRVQSVLSGAGLTLLESAEDRLTRYRRMYEPYAVGLSKYLHMPLPLWLPASGKKDNWQTTAWES
jgi:hypothetical protein